MGPDKTQTDGRAFEKNVEDLFSVTEDEVNEDSGDEGAADEDTTEDNQGQ